LADAPAAHQELAPSFCSDFDGHVFLQLRSETRNSKTRIGLS
jgi:hypothetical protein